MSILTQFRGGAGSDSPTVTEQVDMPKSKLRRPKVKEPKAKKPLVGKKKKRKKKSKGKPIKFRYVAIREDGKKTKGSMPATTQHEVYRALYSQGFAKVDVRTPINILKLDVKKKKVKPKRVAAFSRQLAVFVKSGVPIIRALEVIAKEMDDELFQSVIEDVVAALGDGLALTSALERHPEAFSALYVASLQSAEQTGRLEIALDQMAGYIEREVKMRADIIGAMIYPGIIAVMGAGTVVILSTFVLPKFKVFFASFNAKLPMPTLLLMGISSFLTKWGVIMVGGAVLGVGGAFIYRRTERGRYMYDSLLLRIPIIGTITINSVIERVCRILGSMLHAGVDLTKAMAITADTARNGVYKAALKDCLKLVKQGDSLADAISDTGLFTGTVQQMFRVGEETGTLDYQLEEAANYYAAEVQRKVDHATTLLEPIIITVVGAVVGFVAVAMISAMYGIYNQVHVS